MGEIVRWAMVPIMRAWVSAMERQLGKIPRPTDAPQAHSAGVDSDRILVFGSGVGVGWGVLSHNLALPGALARALSARTGRGADVVSDPRITAASALDALDELKLWRYDAIVVTLGLSEVVSLASLDSWRRELSAILHVLKQASSRSTQIFIAGVYPIRSNPVFDSPLGTLANRHGRALNRVSARVCAETPQTTFVPLTHAPNPSPDRFRSPADYRHWAELLADRMADPLDGEHREIGDGAGEPVAQDAGGLERDRQRAVDDLGILNTEPEDRFDRIIALAQHSFGTRSAAFTLSDGGRLWDKSSVGLAPKEIPRSGSLTTATLGSQGPLVVPDALADDRFRNHPLVVGGPQTRFYAGFPIESPSGERIGVLCVFDPEPRPADEVDTVLLRELALMVQAELQRPQVS